MNKLPVLTHTFLSDFHNCPRKAHHKFILRDLPKEAPSPELQLGRDVHKAMDQRVGEKKPLPNGFQHLEPLAIPFDKPRPPQAQFRTEWKLGMARDGTAREFFSPDVWFRGVLDAVIVSPLGDDALMFDWKTGKIREDPTELALHALLLKVTFPHLETIRGAYVWLKENHVGKIYDLSNVGKTYRELLGDELAVQSSNWRPEPNPLCGWCPVLTCEHNTSGDRKR